MTEASKSTTEHGGSLDSAVPAASSGKTSRAAWLSLATVGVGIMMVQLDGTVVVVANPAIAKDLDAGLNSLQWVMTGYLLVLAGLLIPAGTLVDRIGRKKGLLIGLVGFTIASVLCALSNTIELLIGARVLQGVFGAMMIPAALAVIKAAFPPEKLATAIGLFSGVTAVSLAGGPLLGGVMVEHLTWQWVFLINLPFGVLSVVMAVLFVRESRQEQPEPLDLPGGVALTLSIVSLVWALTHGQEDGWTSVRTLGYIGLSVVLLIVFVVVQRMRRFPMIPLELFRIRSLSVGCLLMVVTMFAFYAIIYYLNFFLQGLQGKSPMSASVALLPLTLTFIVSAPLGGWAVDRFGVKQSLAFGALCITGTSLLLLRLEGDSGVATVGPPLVLGGVGVGFMMVAATQAIVGSAPVQKAGTASGMQQSMSQLGSLLGTAVFGAFLAAFVNNRFAQDLREAFGGKGGQTVEQLADDKQVHKLIELGFPPSAQEALEKELTNAGMSAGQVKEFSATMTQAAHDTFLNGLHTVFLISAGVAVAAALLSLLVSNEDTKGDQMAAFL
ncbi:EmrB/QacA subfamily drug resistance transporter [Streptomyces sp. BK208]|uniref:MFS transporter n=1 Tax=Streptomyces sp. BK208 TaxID=2512150 RepID=UPI00105EBA9C|nr:MFS transporter [Streptomyces sp. BK208]TDT41331.1 EmrB/QacA subfamily drug resistance transporter [Streptomyces sp. BK208]